MPGFSMQVSDLFVRRVAYVFQQVPGMISFKPRARGYPLIDEMNALREMAEEYINRKESKEDQSLHRKLKKTGGRQTSGTT